MYKYNKKKSFKYSRKITILIIITCFLGNPLTVFFSFLALLIYLLYAEYVFLFFFFLSHAMLFLKLDKYFQYFIISHFLSTFFFLINHFVRLQMLTISVFLILYIVYWFLFHFCSIYIFKIVYIYIIF